MLNCRLSTKAEIKKRLLVVFGHVSAIVALWIFLLSVCWAIVCIGAVLALILDYTSFDRDILSNTWLAIAIITTWIVTTLYGIVILLCGTHQQPPYGN